MDEETERERRRKQLPSQKTKASEESAASVTAGERESVGVCKCRADFPSSLRELTEEAHLGKDTDRKGRADQLAASALSSMCNPSYKCVCVRLSQSLGRQG